MPGQQPQPRRRRYTLSGRPGAAADLGAGAKALEGFWPAVTYETRDWEPSEQVLAHVSFFERQRLERSYQSAVLPSVADAVPDLPPQARAAAEEGTDAIIRFDEQMAHLPVPMPAVLLRTESATSSQIEHLTTSARNLAMASLGVSDKENALLVAANVRAMQTALDVDGPVDDGLVLRVHEALLGGSEPGLVGRYRTQQVWIGGGALSPHDAQFVPPHHTRVADAMADLVAFSQRADIPALVHTALAHAQFETIHPFEDGNGRTGRVLLQSLLRRRGLAQHTTIPVSAGLLTDTDAYFRALTAFREGDAAPIIEQVAHAAVAATVNGRMLAADIVAVRDSWQGTLPARTDAAAWRLADQLFAQPVINAEWVHATLGVSDRTARNAIDTLSSAGVLTQTNAARRHKVWQASDVLTAMDAFAARAGRRHLT